MTYTEIVADQRSDAWFAARLGVFTASDADAVVTPTGKPSTKYKALLTKLVCERFTGRSAEDPYTSGDMTRGIELEEQARIAYEFHTGVSVRGVGFLRSTQYLAGCSPDGVIGDCYGLVEIKCPRSPKHFTFIREDKVPAEYLPQLRHQLWVTGAQWVDFVSFDPLMPAHRQLFVKRLAREQADIPGYEKMALAFLAEVEIEYQAWATLDNVTAQLAASA